MFRGTLTIRGPEGVSAQENKVGNGYFYCTVLIGLPWNLFANPSVQHPPNSKSAPRRMRGANYFYWMVTGCTKQAPILFACCSSFKYYLLTHFTSPHYPMHSSVEGTKVV